MNHDEFEKIFNCTINNMVKYQDDLQYIPPTIFLEKNNSTWRTTLLKKLMPNKISVEDCQEERNNCDYYLYVISPKTLDFYLVAKIVDDSNRHPRKTLFCLLIKDDGIKFDKIQLKILNQVKSLVKLNGVRTFNSLKAIAKFLNFDSRISNFHESNELKFETFCESMECYPEEEYIDCDKCDYSAYDLYDWMTNNNYRIYDPSKFHNNF